MGRSPLPERREWPALLSRQGPETENSLRIRKITEIEAKGAEVMTICADIADHDGVQSGIASAHERFGRIHGVFHGAGFTSMNARAFVLDINPAHSDMHFRSKVHGLLLLEKLFKDEDLDFVALDSSMAATFGGLGLAAYSGANQFMDAFAQSRNRNGKFPFISVNWDAWRTEEEKAAPTAGAALAKFSLTPSEGIEAFRRILRKRHPGQIIVSKSLGSAKRRLSGSDNHAAADVNLLVDEVENQQTLENQPSPAPVEATQSHARPELRTAFVAAENETERTIATIWQSLFGITELGVHDNFFDLGGDSLLLLQVQARIRELLEVSLSVAEMFQHPTIEALAQRLSRPAPDSTRIEAAQDRAQLQRAALARHQLAPREALR